MKKTILYTLVILAIAFVVASCSKVDEPTPEPEPGSVPGTHSSRTILVYAIAANSLASNFDMDLKEMMVGMADVDLEQNRLYVYKSCWAKNDNGAWDVSTVERQLLQLVRYSYGLDWKVVKDYGDELLSTDPARISSVIEDVRTLSPSDSYGLVFWSHSDAWNPSPSYTVPQQRCFGQEKVNNKSYYCEIQDLASAVPDDFADFIWFDSCYMANIESMYEFRGKCRRFIGSAIELDAYGMPYNETLPILFSEDGTVEDAARITYNGFQFRPCPGAMSVFDMTKIEDVADAAAIACRNFYPLMSPSTLQRYSRSISPVLYDFGQYIDRLASQNGTDASALQAALASFVTYKDSTPYGYGGMTINADYYSGISCNAYQDGDTKGDTFYRTLAWYKRVYQ